MADHLQHKITRNAADLTGAALIALGITLPRFTVEAKVVDSATQKQVIHDLTGANGVDFIVRVAGFSAQDHRDLVQLVARFIISRLAAQE